MRDYQIKRICWCEKTYNGHEDNPYWEIKMYGNRYGLADDGTMWSIDGLHASPTTRDWIREIISECKLNITLKY